MPIRSAGMAADPLLPPSSRGQVEVRHSLALKVPDRLQDLPSRPRRNRRSPAIRKAIRETHIGPENLLLPVFIHDGEDNIPIHSMPGVDRLGWKTGLLDAVNEARIYGVNSVVLFPKARLHDLSALLLNI